MMKRIPQFLLLWLAFATTSLRAQTVPFLPVDEAPTNAEFLEFRSHLLDSIARHDVPELMRIVHPEIKAGFGGEDGRQAFKEMWNPDRSDSLIWKELEAVLNHGGTFDSPTEFTAPYTFSRWPRDVDPFDFVAVIGSNVRIRRESSPDSPILTSVSYITLKLAPEAFRTDWRQESWTPVVLSDGQKGYIATRYIRSPIDYRARFSRIGGEWKLTMFLAGD